MASRHSAITMSDTLTFTARSQTLTRDRKKRTVWQMTEKKTRLKASETDLPPLFVPR